MTDNGVRVFVGDMYVNRNHYSVLVDVNIQLIK